MPVLPPGVQDFPGLHPTALDIIKSAMRLIGAIDPGEEPEGPEAQDALEILNQMVDSWNIERLMIYGLEMNEFPLVVGQQTYTLGTNGDFDMPRPTRIEAMGLVNINSNPAMPMEIPMYMLSLDDWEQIPVKSIASTYPLYVYDDGSIPFRNLNFWIVPTIVSNVRIYSWVNLSQFTDLTTPLDFPPGYIKAIRYCLAVDLAPEWGLPVPDAVAAQAILERAKIKSFNIEPSVLELSDDLIGGGVANIYTGQLQRMRYR